MTCETRETPTRKTWGKGLTGTGTGWPGIPQGYPWYSLVADALSRADFQCAIMLVPGLKIAKFEPWSWSVMTSSKHDVYQQSKLKFVRCLVRVSLS